MDMRQVISRTISDTQEEAIPNSTASWDWRTPWAYLARMLMTSPSVRGLRERPKNLSPGGLNPSLMACWAFCLGVTHSRLLSKLFVLSPSMWLTCMTSLSCTPKKASATKTWTCFLTLCLTPFVAARDRVIQQYPWCVLCWAMRAVGSVLGFPQRPLAVVCIRVTRPRLLTVYSPSNPTAGLQTSGSIFYLYPGLLPSLRLLNCSGVTSTLGTFLRPSGLAQRRQRPESWTGPGAFQAQGLVGIG